MALKHPSFPPFLLSSGAGERGNDSLGHVTPDGALGLAYPGYYLKPCGVFEMA